MPELFRMFGMRFYFYMNEHEPIHIHVRNGDGIAKFNVHPTLELVEAKGMKPKDLMLAERIIEDKKDEIIAKWKEIFG